MTFSVPGAALSLAILAPSLLLLIWPPRHPSPPPSRQKGHGVLFTGLERAGQALCLVLPAITATASDRDGWFFTTAAALGVYYLLWLRYFFSGREFSALYRPIGTIPVPMAVFPVLAFAAGAGWLTSWPLACGAAILAIGHITNSWRLWRSLRSE